MCRMMAYTAFSKRRDGARSSALVPLDYGRSLVSFDSGVRSQRAMRPRSGSFKQSVSLTMCGCYTTRQCAWKSTVHAAITVFTVYLFLTCIGMAVEWSEHLAHANVRISTENSTLNVLLI